MFMAYVNRVCFVEVRKHVQLYKLWNHVRCLRNHHTVTTDHMHCDDDKSWCLFAKFWTSAFIVLVLCSDCGHLAIDLIPS